MAEKITDKGNVRQTNEDYVDIDITPEYGFYIVCDGIGGHRAGEVASQEAVSRDDRQSDDEWEAGMAEGQTPASRCCVAGRRHRCGQPPKTAKNQPSLDSPLISKLSDPVGQVSTHRPQRVQSGPIGISVSTARPLITVSSTWGTRQTLRQSPS